MALMARVCSRHEGLARTRGRYVAEMRRNRGKNEVRPGAWPLDFFGAWPLDFFLAVAMAAFGAWADTETVGGYTWTYRINGDTAENMV